VAKRGRATVLHCRCASGVTTAAGGANSEAAEELAMLEKGVVGDEAVLMSGGPCASAYLRFISRTASLSYEHMRWHHLTYRI
jgi:hypothetical protein